MRAMVRAYLILPVLEGPYHSQQIDRAHLPAAFGMPLQITEAREVYPDQAYLIHATVRWEAFGLGAPVPVAGFRLRYEPLDRAGWRNLGWQAFAELSRLTPENNALQVRFSYTAMKRPGS